jgi:raffinose/stachyose/melibiose transport system permease protein
MGFEKKLSLQRLFMIVPAFILFTVFVIYPFASGLYYSLTDWDGITVTKFIGLDNYLRLFQDSVFVKASMNTFLVCGVGILIGNPFAILIAILLNQNLKFKGVLRSAFYIPNVMSMMAVSVLWTLILRYEGLLNALLDTLGLSDIKKDWIGDFNTVMPSIIIILFWLGTGVSIIIYLAGLNSIPTEIHEAAIVDGVKPWSSFRHITFPLLMPFITINIFLGLTGGLKLFDLPYVMTGGGPGHASDTIALVIYGYAFKSNLFGYATAAGIVFMIMILAITLIQLKITRSREVDY